jgi:hypothetical protein
MGGRPEDPQRTAEIEDAKDAYLERQFKKPFGPKQFVLIDGVRWCPKRRRVSGFEEGEEYGCHWCLGDDASHQRVARVDE